MPRRRGSSGHRAEAPSWAAPWLRGAPQTSPPATRRPRTTRRGPHHDQRRAGTRPRCATGGRGAARTGHAPRVPTAAPTWGRSLSHSWLQRHDEANQNRDHDRDHRADLMVHPANHPVTALRRLGPAASPEPSPLPSGRSGRHDRWPSGAPEWIHRRRRELYAVRPTEGTLPGSAPLTTARPARRRNRRG